MFLTLFRKLTPRDLLERQLEAAEIERLESQMTAERYGFHVKMLDARISRLQGEIRTIDNPDSQPTQPKDAE